MTNEIFKDLVEFNVISWQDFRLLRFLEELKGENAKLAEEEEKTLVLYFSFLRDGSTCLIFNQKLQEKWQKKWIGLKTSKNEKLTDEETQVAQRIETYFNSYFADLDTVVGCLSLFKQGFPIYFDKSTRTLFAQKFYEARNKILKAVECHFASPSIQAPDSGDDSVCTQIQDKYAKGGFRLKRAQAEAIARGQHQSLIITGGPGTGKTTVVFYLLLEVLQKDEFRNRTIYLTAPSGKAADRLKESIADCCACMEAEGGEKSIIEKIEKAESSTIHRLLKYNPQTNAFSYNAENPFEKNSIFVIDEASMIDVALFAKLLAAIPEGARVYILGDKDQLPSVDAGAAFEEMLKIPGIPLVELDESNRFNSSSAVGKVALALQQNHDDTLKEYLPKWQNFDVLSTLTTTEGMADNLRLVAYHEEKLSLREKQSALVQHLQTWIETFYRPCLELNALALAEDDLAQMRKGEGDAKQKSQLRQIWNWAKRARILAAMREGVYGIDNLNRLVNEKLNGGCHTHYQGEFLMITRNQSALQLFNGDFGLVVMVQDKNEHKVPYFMIEKEGDFIFYLLDLIPHDAFESAFAMTVHKAQGSGYDHLLFFLPESPLSPLANRQVLYTGITRIQKGVLTIIGTPQIFTSCCDTRIVRETGLLV